MFNRERANQELEEQGRTLKWVGAKLGKTPDTIGRYLSGERPCPKDTAIALASVMGLTPDAFWVEPEEAQDKAKAS